MLRPPVVKKAGASHLQVGRAFEWCAALLLLVILAPWLLLIAIFVFWDGGFPVIFKQARIGRCGETFTLYKFRSMVVGAEKMDAVEAHAAMKLKRDKRVTTVGRWLRRFSLDELPQLVNVLRGDMSLVGPRPHLPSELVAYQPQDFRRLGVRPGMTGLWQVSGRAEKSFKEQMAMDLYYVDHRSIWLDMLIVLKTLPAVLFGRGAY